MSYLQIPKWNVRNVQRRTNNNLEAWHSRFNKRVRIDHPNIFVFVEALRKEMDFVQVKLRDMQLELPVQRKNKAYTEVNRRITAATEKYDNGEKTVAEYLDTLAHILSEPTRLSLT
jgi:hypothetical protein